MMVESAAPTWDYRGLGELDPRRAQRDKNHAPRCLMLTMMLSRLIFHMVTKSQILGSSFICTQLLERTFSLGVADFDIDLSFSNLLTSICQRMAKNAWNL